jgi:hypothetical protein
MTDTEQKMYAQFTEDNDSEGESWNFYIPVAGNEEALTQLRELISGKEEYSLYRTLLPESDVNCLVKHSKECYMPEHNKLEGVLDLIDFNTEKLYKGGLLEMMKPFTMPVAGLGVGDNYFITPK